MNSQITFSNQEYKIWVGLRSNLSKYEESKILREMIQNAEDAEGATEVIIKLDTNTYGTNKLMNDAKIDRNNLIDLQGPALLIYNNGVFQPKDWEGIKYIGIGSKKQDIKSIGNFGLGFNSCYHITDNPSIVSGSTYWTLDPVQKVGGGPKIDFVKDKNAHSLYSDQFEPFKQFGCDFKSNFQGTIFRFPLRKVGSELRLLPLSIASIEEILKEFITEIPFIPIFLKKISSITVYKDSNVLSSVLVSNFKQIKKDREKVGVFLESIVNNQMENPNDIVEFTRLLCEQPTSISSSYQMNLEIYNGVNGEKKKINYAISQGIFIPSDPEELIDMVSNNDTKIIPYGGVCIPLGEIDYSTFKGRPFCFLPIGSLEFSSIPCHVNGFFLLSDARSDIKYSTSTKRIDSQEFRSYQWNKFIVNHIVPYFFSKNLEFIKSLGSVQDLYQFFPYQLLGSKIEQELSISTMSLILDESSKFFKNPVVPGKYDSFRNGFIVRKEIHPSIINYLKLKQIQFYSPPNQLINFLESRLKDFKVFSNQDLCKLLKKHVSRLTVYNSDILSILSNDKSIIKDQHLNNVPLIPVTVNQQGTIQLYALTTIYKASDECYLILPESQKCYQLLNGIIFNYPSVCKYKCRFIDPSTVPDCFKENFQLIQHSYQNLQGLTLEEFLSILTNVVNQQFIESDIDLIWECLLENEQWKKQLSTSYESLIGSLNIFPITTKNGDNAYTNFKSSNILSSITNNELESKESILYKLNIYLIKKDHPCNKLFENELPLKRLLGMIGKVGSLENRLSLSSDEINQLRTYLVDSFDRDVVLKDKRLVGIFFNLQIHPCIGDEHNKKFTSIDGKSICIKWVNSSIDQFEIKGSPLIKVNDLSNRLLDQLPITKSTQFIKDEESVFKEYLIPNISKYNLQLSIEIVKSFCSRYLKPDTSRVNNDKTLRERKWIPNINGQFESPLHYYILNKTEMNLLMGIKQDVILHPELLQYSKELVTVGVKEVYPIQDVLNIIPHSISKTGNSQMYLDFMDYLKQNSHQFNVYQNIPQQPQQQQSNNSEYYINQKKKGSNSKVPHPQQAQQPQPVQQPQSSSSYLNSQLERILNIDFIPSCFVDTYPGFEPTTMCVSPNNSTILSNSNSLFTVKFPIDIDTANPLYKYLAKEDHKSIIRHWVKLSKFKFDNDPITSLFKPDELSDIFNSIYKAMSKLIQKHDFIKSNNNNKSSIIDWDSEFKQIKSFGKIWIKDSFISINDLSINDNSDFEPYIYSISSKFPLYKELFRLIGVQQSLQIRNYQLILVNIFYKYQLPSDKSVLSTGPIPKKEMDMCLLSLNSIGDLIHSTAGGTNMNIQIPHIPTNDSRLVDFKKVLFCDQIELPASLLAKGYFKLNNKVSPQTISLLKVRREQQVIQRDNNSSLYFKGFGQREKLTDRLRSILIDYSTESFLNEMVQNSSDANADIVELVYDSNYYENEYIDIEHCKDFNDYLQPSLLVYNNSVFTDQDIENIQNMSGTNKKNDGNSIGKFGIGATSIYNFTNCPCILSGKYLMIFDPLVSHLEAAEDYSPGLKLEIADHNSHPDLFKPFVHYQKLYNFNLDDGYFNGTIIRLPLRQQKQLSSQSKNITDNYWNFEKVYELFTNIIDNNIENLMLFTKITRIKLSTLSKADERDHCNLLNYITLEKKDKKILVDQKLNNHLVTCCAFPIEIYEMKFDSIKQNQTTQLTYLIGKTFDNYQQQSSSSFKNIPAFKFVSIYSNGRDKRKVNGGIAFKILSDKELLEKKSSSSSSKSFCYLPFKDIPFPVHVQGGFSVSTTREILDSNKSSKMEIPDPLISTLDSNQQNQDSFAIAWNKILIESIVSPIYVNTLAIFKQLYVQQKQSEYYNFYYNLFPTKDKNSTDNSIFSNLVSEFYSIIENSISKPNTTKLNLFLPVIGFNNNNPSLPNYYMDKEDIKELNSVLKDQPTTTTSQLNEQLNNLSVVKVCSLFSNISTLPKNIYTILFKAMQNQWITSTVVLNIIKKKEIPSNVISNEEIVNIFSYVKNVKSVGNLIDCQLLLFADGTREYFGERHSLLFNKDYYAIYPHPFEFVDEKLSALMVNQTDDWLKSLKIEKLKFSEFFFNYLLPNFNKFKSNHIEEILELLKLNFNSLIESESTRISKEPIIPFIVNDDTFDVIKFKSISNLFDTSFKKYNLELDYPPEQFDTQEWNTLFKKLKIKQKLDDQDLFIQFKSVSREYGNSLKQVSTLESDSKLIGKVMYLWEEHSSSEIHKIWKDIISLSIIPTKDCKIIGSRKNRPLLSTIYDCVNEVHKNICFSTNYISSVNIPFPLQSTTTTNNNSNNNNNQHYNIDSPYNIDNVFKNLISIIGYFQKKSKYTTDDNEMFLYLYENCYQLEKHLQLIGHTIHIAQSDIDSILSLPNEESKSPIPFINMILDSDFVPSPFFNKLPSKLLKYPLLCTRLGVKKLNGKTISDRFKSYPGTVASLADQRIVNKLYDSIPLDELDALLVTSSLDFPILTDQNTFKPLSQVVYFDSPSLQSRISLAKGLIYNVNSNVYENIPKLRVGNLSSSIKESVDFEKTDLIYENAILGKEKSISTLIAERKSDPDFIVLLDSLFGVNGKEKHAFLSLQVFSGQLFTRLYFNGFDITSRSKADYYYNENQKHLYVSYEISIDSVFNLIYSTILRFSPEISRELNNFGKVDTGDQDDNDQDDEDDDSIINYTSSPIGSSSFINGEFKFRTGQVSNVIVLRAISKQLHDSAEHDLKVANTLLSNGFFDDVAIYSLQVIEKSIKSILVSQGVPFKSNYRLNYLKNLLPTSSVYQLPDIPVEFESLLLKLKYESNLIDKQTATSLLSSTSPYFNFSEIKQQK